MTKHRNHLTLRDRIGIAFWPKYFRVKAIYYDFLYWLTGENPYAEEEYCMCGELVDYHNIGSGHSPVSQTDYYRKPPVWRRIFRKAKP